MNIGELKELTVPVAIVVAFVIYLIFERKACRQCGSEMNALIRETMADVAANLAELSTAIGVLTVLLRKNNK